MNALRNLRLGVRLGLGFAILPALMAAMLLMGLLGLARLGGEADQIISRDWIKAEAAATVNRLVRANARRTMELFFASDKTRLDRTRQFIESNKGRIGEALGTLDPVTQQNAALVEQGAAAADSLSQQASDLVRAVSMFKIGAMAA